MQEQPLARVAARFQAKIRREGDHQVWTGAVSKGLGAFKLGGRTEKASRVAWPLERLCEVPGCVTPAHHRERGRAAAADRSMALGAPVPWSCSPPTGQAR